MVVGGTNEMLQSRENVWHPGPCRFEIGQTLTEKAFVDRRRLIHFMLSHLRY